MPNYDLMTQADYELYIKALEKAERKNAVGEINRDPEALNNIRVLRQMKQEAFWGYFGAKA